MQAAAMKWTRIPRLGKPPEPPPPPLLIFFSLLHSTPPLLAKWKSKWDVTKDCGNSKQPSKPYVRYAVRQKRSDAKKALENLLNGKPSNHQIQGQKFNLYDEATSQRKNASHSHSNCSKKSKGTYTGSKGRQYNNLYDDDDEYYYSQPEPKFTATFAGYQCYTWSFESWENTQRSTSGFEWRDDTKWERAKKRVWSESELEDDSSNVGSHSHRVALGLPPTGPLKLEDVKTAFRASALKWHPDKHQGHAQPIAGEKFKRCLDAYKSLCSALKSS